MKIIALLSLLLISCTIQYNLTKPAKVFDPTNAYASMASISVEDATNKKLVTICSGFAVSKDRIVTAGHCSDAILELQSLGLITDQIIIGSYGSDKSTIVYQRNAEILSIDSINDISVLGLEGHGILPVVFAKKLPALHEPAYIVGCPAGVCSVASSGEVMQKNYKVNEMIKDKLIVSAAATGGNSGSAVYNKDGEVIGMLVMGLRSFDHLSICTTKYKIEFLLYLLNNVDEEE